MKRNDVEAMREDAMQRAEVAWSEIAERLAANAVGDDVKRAYAAEERAIRLVCLMKLAARKAPTSGSRQSVWKDRAQDLARLDDALLKYIAGFPVGSGGDLPWSFEARAKAAELREHLMRELRWRKERQAHDAATPGVASVVWSPASRPGPKDGAAYAAIARLASEYCIEARDLALLESIARLPVEPFTACDGKPLLHPWNPRADDCLFLPPGEARFDSQLRHEGVVKAWKKRIKW